MDVRCPECDTLYEVDTRQLRGSASTLKCSQCEHIFHMQAHAALIQENQRRWMLRSQPSGDIRYFVGFDELHRWILQGEAVKKDDISRTGKRWRTLGSIGEFMPIFQAVESISSINNARETPPSANAAPAVEQPPTKQAPATPSHSPVPPQPNNTGPKSSPRPRVGTSRQFAMPANQSPPSSKPPNRQPPSQNPAPARQGAPGQRPTRTHTPISSKARAVPPGPPRQGAADTPSRGQKAPPRAHLQTGAFGRAPGNDAQNDARQPTGEHQRADDQWSLGELPLGMAEGHEIDHRGREVSGAHAQPGRANERSGPYSTIDEAAGSSSSSRRNLTILTTVLLVLGVGAALYVVYPPFVEDIFGPKPALSGSSASPTPLADETPPSSTPQKPVISAKQKAEEAAIVEELNQLHAAIEAAHPGVDAALKRGSQKAEDAAKKAAEEAAREPSVDELLASANRALNSGNAARARKKFHKILDKDRTNSSAITGLGWSLLAMNRAPAAAAQFHKAIALNAGYGDAYIGLGKAERDIGNHQKALTAYQTYLDKFPGGSKASIARYQADKLKQALGQ